MYSARPFTVYYDLQEPLTDLVNCHCE